MHDTTVSKLQALLDTQRAAFTQAPTRSAAMRHEDLRKIEVMATDHQQEWVDAVSADFGNRAATETRLLELSVVASGTKAMRRHLGRWMRPRKVATPLIAQPGRSWVRHDPKGVVGVLSPWNYPVQLSLMVVASALAGGNRVILKPSELTPHTNAVIRRLFAEAFSEDQVAVVEGGPDVAEAFSNLPFDHIFFTGSTRVGRSVAAAAGRNLVPVTLELGGKSPAIVTPQYDIKDAAHPIAWGRFLNAGQTCVAVDHVLSVGNRDRANQLGQAIAEQVASFYPDFVDNPDYSSIISGQHFDRLTRMVEEARAQGTTILQPPHDPVRARQSRKFPPTVILDPAPNLQMMREEIFGPILPVIATDTVDSAIAHVNGDEQPLALYVFSHDNRQTEHVLAHTRSGGVTVNGALLHLANENLPFGGIGPSGQGAYHGKAGFDEMTHARAVFKAPRWHTTRLVAPPYGKRAKSITDIALKL